jgi:diguanylate cyclase (GGDEF)-like protein/PAS domain S-box-containing protein
MDTVYATPSAATSERELLELTEIGEEATQDAYESSLPLNKMNRLLLESVADGVYATDAKGRTTFINSAAMRMTGWTAEEILGKPERVFARHLPSRHITDLHKPASRTMQLAQAQEEVFCRKDGSSFPATCAGTSVLRHGQILGTVVIFRDLSETMRMQKWEQSKNAIFSAILGHRSLPSTMQLMADAFVALYPPKSIAIFVLAGDQFHIEAEAGLPPRAVRPAAAAPASVTLARSQERSRARSESLAWKAISGSCDGPAPSSPAFLEILKTGVKLCMASPLRSCSGEATGMVTVFDTHQAPPDGAIRETIRSICDLGCMAIEHRHLYDQVVHGSHYDLLTGLPNRILLEDRLRQAMVTARRQRKLIAVCCIDLDRFKQINDNLGHELGDVCFKAATNRLKAAIRNIDVLARHGGDEFILVLPDLAEISAATNICHRLLKQLSAPMLVDGHSLTLHASVGISIFPDHGDSPDSLLRNAAMALAEAKHKGRGQAQIYSPELARQSRRAAEMADALAVAVAKDQFRVAYQPIYSMNREIMGFEALLRWKHPSWGWVAPLEFIPIAEETGLIVPIGDWVIDEVCRQAMAWNAASAPPVKLFVNVSGVQLGRPNFSSKIADALERSGLAPDRLELEITESWIISDLREAAAKLRKLRDLGVGIAIDDFGTGHSTFSYLQALPLDTLKIDRSFVLRLDGTAANQSTVRAITGLAQQLGLKTVAEGVETEQHLQQLAEIGCELLQGFLLGRPLTPQAACSLLMKQSFPAANATTAVTPCLSR